eukprot:238351_1
MWWTVGLLLGIAFLTLLNEWHIAHIALWIIFVLIFMIGLGVVTIAHSKFHWILHILLIIEMIINAVIMFLFDSFTASFMATGLLNAFGVTAVYILKVSEMNKMNGSAESVQQEKDLEDVISHHLPNKGT